MSPKKSAPAIDPTSAELVLRYLGDEGGDPHAGSYPARDLSHNDIARLVYVGSDAEDRIAADHADYEVGCADLVALLVGTGIYTSDVPAPAAPVSTMPAAPAESEG